MNKQELLKDYKKQEDKICLAQVLDKIEISKKTNKIQYTDFLDMYQVSLVQNFLRKIQITNCKLYGGYEEAERKIVIIYPENYTESMIEKNYNKMLKIVRIQLPEEEKGKYSHRNYLGGIVKLGMKREKVGDILVSDDGADILVKAETAETLKQELGTLTRFENSKIEIIELQDVRKPEIKLEEITIIVPSLRLDSIVAELANVSRNKASIFITSERVLVNYTVENKTSKEIKIEDIITIRGKGRFVVKAQEGTSKKGKKIITVEKFK